MQKTDHKSIKVQKLREVFLAQMTVATWLFYEGRLESFSKNAFFKKFPWTTEKDLTQLGSKNSLESDLFDLVL